MVISAHVFNGRVVFDDRTHQDEYEIILSLLSRCGVEQNIQTASWCG